ncbi:MAG TPA: nuclear transport factor 2 family protein [Hymenobacter sp.]|jgi:ketosteroid isomerase-like protein
MNSTAFTPPTNEPAAAVSATIEQLELRLRQAQLAADVAALAELLADDLLFADMQGRMVTKAEDLEAYRSGLLRITAARPLQQIVRVLNATTAVASVLAEMKGTMAGHSFQQQVRYLRVWAQQAGQWQVVAGHVTTVLVPES